MKQIIAGDDVEPSDSFISKLKNEFNKRHFWQFIRYLLMGGIGVMSYLFFSNFYNWLGVETYLSPFYAWISGLAIVYFGHMKFTFRVKARHKQMVFRFLVMQTYNLSMSTLSTIIVCNWLNFDYFIASLVALGTTVPVLYLLGKNWVYQPYPVVK